MRPWAGAVVAAVATDKHRTPKKFHKFFLRKCPLCAFIIRALLGFGLLSDFDFRAGVNADNPF